MTDPAITVATPSPLVLPSSTSILAARARMLEAGQALALVTHRGHEVGVISVEELDGGAEDDGEPVNDILCRELVHVDPWAEGRRTVVAYREASWASLRRRRPARPRAGARWGGVRPPATPSGRTS